MSNKKESRKDKMQEMINVTLDWELWDGLARFAHSQSITGNKRFATIRAFRLAVKVFLRLKPREINAFLKWNPIS